MRRAFTLSACALAVLASGAVAWNLTNDHQAPSLLRPDDAAFVAQGSRVYAEHCAACHGSDLSGEPGWPDWRQRKPDGRLAAPPHDETGHTWHHPDEMLFQITKLGTAGYIGNPEHPSDMPAFAEVLSDQEIAAALSFIKSNWTGAAKEANARLNAKE